MKNFDEWNEVKKNIEAFGEAKLCKAREIWWCRLGINIGREQDGGVDFRRPVLIMRKLSDDTCLVLPVTTSESLHKYRIKINDTQAVVVTQMRVLDTIRFIEKVSVLETSVFDLIRKTVRDLI